MAAPAFVAVATTDNQASSTTWILTTPTHSVGDLLVAALYLDVDPVTITPPAGWTLKHQQECAGLLNIAVFFKIAGASEPGTFSFSLSTAAVGSHLIASYSGVDPSSPVEADFGSQPPDFSSSCGAFAAQQAPSVVTTTFENRVLTFMLGVGGTGWTPDVKTTERADMRSLSAVADGHLADFVKVSPGNSSTNGAVIHTYSVAGGRVQITIALKPPVSAPTTPITFVDLTEEISKSASVIWRSAAPIHSPGDLLVFQAVTTNSNMTFSLAGWTLVARIPCTTPNSTLHVFTKIAGPSEPALIDFLITADSFGSSMMASYSGVDSVNPVEADTGEQPPDINASCIDGGSPSQVVPGLVTTVADAMMLTMIGSDGGDQGWTPDAGMQARSDVHGFMDLFFAEEVIPVAGATGTRTHVFSATKKYVALMMALQPARAPCFEDVVGTGNQGSATTWVLTTPTHSVGDLLLAALYVNADTVIVTPPAGFVLVTNGACSGLTSLHLFRKIAGVSEPATFSFTMSFGVVGSHLMASYSGVDTVSPLEASIGRQPPDLSPSCVITAAHSVPQITTTVADVRVVTFVLGQLGISWIADASTTQRADIQSPGAVADGHLADFVQTVAGPTGGRTHTYSVGTQKYIAIMIGLKPALPVVEAAFQLPVASRGVLERLLGLPAETRGGAEGLFGLPIQTLPSFARESPFFIPIATFEGVTRLLGVPIEFTGTLPLSSLMTIPIQAAGGLEGVQDVPVEALGGITINKRIPVQALEGVTSGKQLPVEFKGTLAIDGKFIMPIEALGGVGLPQSLPVEADGLIFINATQQLPVATIANIVRQFLLPVEAFGEFGVILHTFNVIRPLADPFVHSWVVIPVAFNTQLPHTWLVSNILGGVIDHTWRVLPDKIITLFGDDIQCPAGTADKP